MPILAGLETEYGLYVEGRGAENQVEDSMALVRSDPNEGRFLWDYRYESPRRDLRGFTADRLSVDPADLEFDRSKPPVHSDQELRSDRILPNGARFYNDHGHPEFATPECWTLHALTAHDRQGERHVFAAAQELATRIKRDVQVYKNNTDFHGSSYGTHESYLIPRSLTFETLQKVLLPLFAARTLLCGAGKVGSELAGEPCTFQLSARADFFSETASVDTLYRRPIFNTRDEPHARTVDWTRLHVICGDANCLPSATRRKVGLVKLALELAIKGWVPDFPFESPVKSFQAISRQTAGTFAEDLLERYLRAYETNAKGTDPELDDLVTECRDLLQLRTTDFAAFSRQVDWAAKQSLLEMVGEEPEATLRAYDLEYSNVDPETSLSATFAEPDDEDLMLAAAKSALEPTRARARGLAIRYPELTAACWRTLSFGDQEIELSPTSNYRELSQDLSVESFIAMCKEKM